MPTTTASKAGLRAKATATRTKAAQRTPLPAKDHAENVRLAKEAVAEAKPVKRTRATAKPTEVATPATRGKPPAEAPKPDKADHYAAEFIKLGWKPEITRLDGLHELVATRGTEAIYLAWLREAHVSGTSTYTIADRTVKVRNPAEAMRLAARKPEEARAQQAKVASNKSFVKRATGPTLRSVPFDVNTATDEEVAVALEAHLVEWHNPYRVESERATVGQAKSIHISRHARGHRIVSFVDPANGFRAFKLENLENVGRKVSLDRIKQEILASLSRIAKGKAA